MERKRKEKKNMPKITYFLTCNGVAVRTFDTKQKAEQKAKKLNELHNTTEYAVRRWREVL